MLFTPSTLAWVPLISAEHCKTAPQWVMCFNGNPVCCCKSRPHELNSCLAAFVLHTQGPTLGLVWESFDFFNFFGHFGHGERSHVRYLWLQIHFGLAASLLTRSVGFSEHKFFASVGQRLSRVSLVDVWSLHFFDWHDQWLPDLTGRYAETVSCLHSEYVALHESSVLWAKVEQLLQGIVALLQLGDLRE